MLSEAGKAEGEEFVYTEAPIGGAAIDAAGDPYPASTEEICKASDAVLLACIGGYKWDSLPNAQRPEKGLLRLRSSLNAFANLRPAVVLPQLADASTLKREVRAGGRRVAERWSWMPVLALALGAPPALAQPAAD